MPRNDTGNREQLLVRTQTPFEIYNSKYHLDSKTIAYFRGRKLNGKQLKIPKGYRGIVILSTDRILPKETPAEDDEDAEEVPEVKVMEEQSEFEDIMVWGHEVLPDDTTDPYMRGVQEWIAFADQVCWESCWEYRC
jgi:ribonuclease H2 subunit C